MEGEGGAAPRRERAERRRGEGRRPAARMERVGAEGEGRSGGAERVGQRPATRRERIRDGGGAGGCVAAAADGIESSAGEREKEYRVRAGAWVRACCVPVCVLA